MKHSTRRNVHILDNGGTMSGEEVSVPPVPPGRNRPGSPGITKVVPQRGKILQLLRHDVPNASSYNYTHEILDYFRDSGQYDYTDIMGIVAAVRKSLRDHPHADLIVRDSEGDEKNDDKKADLIIPGGSDTFSQVIMGIAQGVSPEELQDRCILGVAAQKHASPNRPEGHEGPFYDPDHCQPVKSMSSGLYLATHKYCRGRILLLCGNLLLPARGCEKVDARGPQPFSSRLTATAASPNATLPLPEWPLDEPRWMELPTGKQDQEYTLVGGVESFALDTTSDYLNTRNFIWGALNCHEFDDEVPPELRGVILALPGDKNLRNNPREFNGIVATVNMCEAKGIPVGVIASPMYKQHNHRRIANTQYEGNVSNLAQQCGVIDFEEATISEAKMLNSQFMAEAIALELSEKERLQYVRQRVQEYFEHMNRNDGYVPL